MPSSAQLQMFFRDAKARLDDRRAQVSNSLALFTSEVRRRLQAHQDEMRSRERTEALHDAAA